MTGILHRKVAAISKRTAMAMLDDGTAIPIVEAWTWRAEPVEPSALARSPNLWMGVAEFQPGVGISFLFDRVGDVNQ